ncbi:hypothetical protein [Longimicrobium sp.]|uniref:hypothetical protein n=1 Tax=Longimicrobium sp. TaxID=2029185 RepID=UPI002E34072E|nr:hypothetical protein [Longimicrobium sp.]HEX6040920.1 hypothetical protein [Longimicrobium sp.]
MTLSIRSLGISLALFLAVVGGGCSDVDPTGSARPAQVEPAGPSLSAGQLNPLARFRTRPQVTIAWAKKWIGPEGGRLDFMGFAIDVPAGAVDRVTMFTLKLPVDPNGSEHVVAEFGPHAVKFAKPVSIEFPYRGTTIEGSSTPTVVWWNGGWVGMGGSVTSDGQRLRTTTDHFSTYGTTATLGTTFVTSGG